MDVQFLTFDVAELHGGEVALDIVCGVEAVGLSLRLAPCLTSSIGMSLYSLLGGDGR